MGVVLHKIKLRYPKFFLRLHHKSISELLKHDLRSAQVPQTIFYMNKLINTDRRENDRLKKH